MRYRILIIALTGLVLVTDKSSAVDWNTAPSYYTHDPLSGRRVNQYTPIGPFYLNHDPTYVRSGFRHSRSSLQVGTSADHMIVVEEWGRPVRPFGEWRFPYRPFSAPYDLWGAPFAGAGAFGGFGWGGFPGGFPGGFGGAVNPYPPFQGNPPPYYNGNYHDYRRRNRAGNAPPPANFRRNRPFGPFPGTPGGVGGINIGPGNTGDITIDGNSNTVDNDGVDGNGNTVGGDVINNP